MAGLDVEEGQAMPEGLGLQLSRSEHRHSAAAVAVEGARQAMQMLHSACNQQDKIQDGDNVPFVLEIFGSACRDWCTIQPGNRLWCRSQRPARAYGTLPEAVVGRIASQHSKWGDLCLSALQIKHHMQKGFLASL